MLIVECILNVYCLLRRFLLRHHRHPLLPYVILLDRRFVISAPFTAENCPPPGAVNNNRSAAAFSGYSAALLPHSGVVTSPRRRHLSPASLPLPGVVTSPRRRYLHPMTLPLPGVAPSTSADPLSPGVPASTNSEWITNTTYHLFTAPTRLPPVSFYAIH